MVFRQYLTKITGLALVVPAHELVHAAVCVVLGGSIVDIHLFSHMTCGGTVANMLLYDAVNGLNQVATVGVTALYGARMHLPLLQQGMTQFR